MSKKEKAVRVILIALGVAFIFVMLVLPLITVLAYALREGWHVFTAAVADRYTILALQLTLVATVSAVLFNTVFGLFSSWAITKFRFRGKQILTTLIDIPFAISPVIAGLVFILVFGRIGWANGFLQAHDIKIVFATPGIILATIFVTFPFISKELIPLMQSQGSDEEEAAALAGHLRGKTNTLPLHVEILFNEFHLTQAFAVSSILVVLAIIILILKNIVEYKGQKEVDEVVR